MSPHFQLFEFIITFYRDRVKFPVGFADSSLANQERNCYHWFDEMKSFEYKG